MESTDIISFAGEGLAADLLPVQELADCAATVLARDGSRILSYGAGAGYTPLRELLAEHYGVHPYRVVLTNGWLQGFATLAQRLARGRAIVIEYPTYDRALRLLFAAGANLLYLDVSEHGLNLEHLAVVLRTAPHTPAFAYTMPTFHNPTGWSLPGEQRGPFCDLLLRARVPVIEDDSAGLLRYEGEPEPTLFELSGQQTTYSSSFSLTLAPGLRVGVFVLPDELAGLLAAAATDAYITPALLAQATVFEFMQREGSFDAHLESLRGELRARRDVMLDGLEASFPDATFSRPRGGIFITLSLPPGTDARSFLERAQGVTALSGLDFGGPPNALRLNFGGCSSEQIEAGIERLAAASAAGAAAS